MFAFLVNAWRSLEAAIVREAHEAERSADLRKAYNDHVEQSLTAMGVLTDATNNTPKKIKAAK